MKLNQFQAELGVAINSVMCNLIKTVLPSAVVVHLAVRTHPKHGWWCLRRWSTRRPRCSIGQHCIHSPRGPAAPPVAPLWGLGNEVREPRSHIGSKKLRQEGGEGNLEGPRIFYSGL